MVSSILVDVNYYIWENRSNFSENFWISRAVVELEYSLYFLIFG